MKFIKATYKTNIPENVESIKDILEFDYVQFNGQNEMDFVYHNVQKIIDDNKNVQTVKSPSCDNTLLFISSMNNKTDFDKSVDSIIELNEDINVYLYPSEVIEECKEDAWYYPNLDLIVMKYNSEVLMKLI